MTESYCLDSSWTLTFLTNSPCSPFFPHQGGKYMEIQGNSWNSGKFGQFVEFSWVILVQGTQATQAKDTQVTLTHTKRQRKFELFNPSQAKPAWAAQARCNSAALSCDYITPVALVQQSSGTEWQQVASSACGMCSGTCSGTCSITCSGEAEQHLSGMRIA